jgi:hypothetical protein
LVIDKVINKLFHFAGEVTQFHQLVKVEEGNDGVLGIAGNVNYLENKNYQSPWGGIVHPSIQSMTSFIILTAGIFTVPWPC